MNRNKILRFTAITAVILLAIYAFSILTDSTRGFEKVDTSVAIQQLKDKNAKTVEIKDREQQLEIELKKPIKVKEQEGVEKLITQYPARGTDEIFADVQQAAPESFNTKVTKDSFLVSMLTMLIPMVLFFVVIMFLFSRMQGGGGMGGVFGMGKSRAKELTKDMPKTTFADVAGADEAVEELNEIKDFLQGPARYETLGAKIPRGVLLYGPPGTGKTLLARAVAGEAGVPFYSISGSDFVEMFVGVGASRVRDLFTQAKANAPCIIFVDEIDAVGRQRGAGMGGGHDEREQTLNQLLVEMDGFGDRQGVILIAATNRPDILDPALLRPGRFDRQIPVTNPDLAGREHILQVHAKNKPLGPDVDLKSLAKRTAGMSGADLENVLNEAALLTARVNGNIITADALEEATDRVVGGPRRTSKIISEHEKKVTAYHEGGHTLAAWAMKDIERVYKVTILARGRTGGHAMTAAEDDKGMYTQAELFARLVFAMGGRSGEELVFGTPTTGASADIEQATKIARAMVTEYGMSPDLGTVKYGEEQGDPFAGRGGGGSLEYSDEVAATIDQQVRQLISKAHDEAYAILKENRDTLDRLAAKLLEKETLRRPDLEKIFEDVTPRERLSLFDDWDRYPKDDREPVKTPVELAKERGEEPPKCQDFLAAARQAQQDRQAQQPGQPGQPVGYPQQPQQPQSGYGQENPESPVYGGTPPPAGWTAPGWPPADQAPRYNGGNAQPNQPQQGQSQQGQPQAPQGGYSQSQNGYQQHPGMSNYGEDRPYNPFAANPTQQGPNGNPADGYTNTGKHGQPENNGQQAPSAPQPNEPLRGFRLPDNERPDNPWNDQDSKDAPTTSPAQSPLDVNDADDESTRILPRPNDGDEGAHRAPDPDNK